MVYRMGRVNWHDHNLFSQTFWTHERFDQRFIGGKTFSGVEEPWKFRRQMKRKILRRVPSNWVLILTPLVDIHSLSIRSWPIQKVLAQL